MLTNYDQVAIASCDLFSPLPPVEPIVVGEEEIQPQFLGDLDNLIKQLPLLGDGVNRIGDLLQPHLDNLSDLAPRFEDLIPNFFNTAKYDPLTGYGLVNAAAAVSVALFGSFSTPFWNVQDLGGNEWANDLIKSPEVWQGTPFNRPITGEGVVVAVIDDGVDISHPDIAANIWRNPREIPDNGIDDDGNGFTDDIHGWNFTTDSNNNDVRPASPLDVHGTHVAGTIAALRNDLGSTGVAPNAKIMPIKIADTTPDRRWQNVSPSNIARAIRYAVDNGAAVINMSFGFNGFAPEMRDALEYAASKNVVTVAAAGNKSGNTPMFPANQAISWGISVGSVGRDMNLSDFSNRAGNHSGMLHVMAPGESIHSLALDQKFCLSSGTSMAAPHVAGVVALMKSANPHLSASDIRKILAETATKLS
ncbi:MAG: S8 family peptidase [Pseudanabaenaceae cyanobacterium]